MEPKDFYSTVLVVDDEPFILRTTEAVLKHLGFSYVETADSVDTALGIMSDVQPPVGLVLSDLNMPGADGLELLQRFDEMEYQGDILLFSGEDQQTLRMAESLAKARGLAVIGAIAKPIQPDRLLELLANGQTASAGRRQQSSDGVAVTQEMLAAAIDAGELKPWFQPKIDVASRMPVGVEALARWPDSVHGPIYPNDFIPAAEKYGLIDQLTFALMQQAARMGADWQQQGFDLKIAFNVSMNSLYDPAFPDTLDSLITQAGGSLQQFQLEVTESQLMEDIVRPLEALLRLRMKKVRLSIDDFGTGHSNLSQLRDLPFDELKLDRSYVQTDGNSDRTGVILESAVDMARKLGMSIVAEGVETLQEWQKVEQLGCEQVQGYFCARPMPGDEIVDWLTAWPEQRQALFDQ